ncbi:hypothetical protein DYB30_006825 [Aphanomyces astaci]|uniref:Anaphase-promoting complex subunit 4-like WD40 domain-containing protein n=1 Tax=Aphanomyces astaci TaxID=112090 RepID=A0A397DX97_APHAT|nr:hypothetical protein DYB30_006825 [Aphanomyces astaci]RQM20271.1 hypothetical protein B5M09_008616 [Aphanomyces astaci]
MTPIPCVDRIKRLAPSITISECPSEVFCTRFSPDGALLAAGCGDGAIRIFNVQNGTLAYTLMQPHHNFGFGMPCTAIRFRPLTSASKTKNVLLAVSTHGTLTAGHSNRVFSVKYHPLDENTIVSGGWDNTIQIWDTRVGHSVRGIYGPHIAGDAIDINAKNEILTGSWRPENPLELIGTVAGLSRGVFTLDFSPAGDKLALAGADAAIRIIDIYDYVPGDKARERPVTPSIKYVRIYG